MCVVSMVHDHFADKLKPFLERQDQNLQRQWQYTPSTASADLLELRKLIAEFRELVAAAKKIDEVTGQPDCVDPAKATLDARVTALEAQMAKLVEAFK